MRQTSSGRIVLAVETSRYIYLFEFKLDKTSREVLEQINFRDYALHFSSSGRKIIKIGANFSTRTRDIDDFLIEM